MERFVLLDPIFQAVLIPIFIAYFLIFINHRKGVKSSSGGIVIPFRDFALSTLILDLSAVLPETMNYISNRSGDLEPLLVLWVIFIFHFTIFMTYKNSKLIKDYHDESMSSKDKKLSTVFTIYIAFGLIITNGSTFQLLVFSARWF